MNRFSQLINKAKNCVCTTVTGVISPLLANLYMNRFLKVVLPELESRRKTKQALKPSDRRGARRGRLVGWAAGRPSALEPRSCTDGSIEAMRGAAQ